MHAVQPITKWSVTLFMVLFAVFTLGASITVAQDAVVNVWLNTASPAAITLMTQELIPEFEEAHPGIRVEFRAVGWKERADALVTAFAAGVGPDVFEIGSGQVIEDVKNGFPLSLDAYLSNWDQRDDFIPEAWRATEWGGAQYGVPYTMTGRHLFYFKGVFEEVGLNGDTPPKTWDDITEYTRKLHHVDSEGNILRIGADLQWTQIQSFIWFLWQNKGEMVDEVTGKALFASREGVETLEFYRNLYNMQGLPAAFPHFNRRGVGMNYNSTHDQINNLRNNAPELLDELRLFVPEHDGVSVWPLYINSLAISKQSANPDAAWAFIDWFSRTENAIRYLEANRILSPNFRALETEYIQDDMRAAHTVYADLPFARRTDLYQARINWGQFILPALQNQVSTDEALQAAALAWDVAAAEAYR